MPETRQSMSWDRADAETRLPTHAADGFALMGSRFASEGSSRHTLVRAQTMPASMTAAAAANHVWISCANSSARESLWPAYLVRADGITTGRLRRNVPGVLVTEIDTAEDLYDSTALWRDRALRGVLHSGHLEDDPRSADRSSF